MSALEKSSPAWEPLTPRGVAAFARASFERLFIMQGVFALFAAAAVTWLLADGVFPVIDETIRQLPDMGAIHGGKLDWRDDSPVPLAEGKILSVSVDLEHGGKLRSPADFQFEFGRDTVEIVSLFGTADLDYPNGYYVAANQREARPAWGAWAPNLLGLAAIGTFFGVLAIWFVLASVYFLPVWLVGFFANRDLGFCASWKLAAAALMPGATILSVALVLYDYGAIDLVQTCFAFGMHLVIGWIYLFVSPMFLERGAPSERKNPFAENA